MASFALSGIWVFNTARSDIMADVMMTSYLFAPFCFILPSLLYCFYVIYKNKEKIQNEDTHIYYEKFMIITIWLICIQLVFYYYLYKSNLKNEGTFGVYLSIIIFLCVVNYFVTRFNSIYFIYFSADG